MLDKPSLWKVTFTSWPDFLETVSTRDGPAWALLMRETDLIIGGLDFESDFLYANQNAIRSAFLTIIPEIQMQHLAWTELARWNI